MRRVERKELKYSTMNLSVDCLLRSISVREREEGEKGRERERRIIGYRVSGEVRLEAEKDTNTHTHTLTHELRNIL